MLICGIKFILLNSCCLSGGGHAAADHSGDFSPGVQKR